MFFFDNNEIVDKLKKYPIWNQFSDFTLRRLVSKLETVYLETDQVLVHRGDPCDCVYYVLDGYLEGFSSSRFTQKLLDFHAGELIGDVSIFADEPHSLTIKAIRESQLLKINTAVFLNFFQKKPDLLMVLTKIIAKNFRHTLAGLEEMHYPYKNIGFVIMCFDMPIEKLKMVFQSEAKDDNVYVYDKAAFKDTQMEIIPFFHQCENNSAVNIFIADKDDGAWRKAVLEQVDYVYLMTYEGTWEMLNPEILLHLRHRPCDIVVMHTTYGNYKDTDKFYERYPFTRHHHVVDKMADYQRLYRFATGQAIGLVFSGGGLRGIAHYGVVKALLEAKIPIDYIGGCSIGACLGATLAVNYNLEYFETTFHRVIHKINNTRRWKYLTLPIISVLSGSVVTRILKDVFGSYKIEDLPINFFCVTANLSDTRKDIKNRGELWEWLRASLAIPGVFPPFEKEGKVYVDGGVCSNLPVFDMRTCLNEAGTIITSDIQVPPFQQHHYNIPPVFGFWDALSYGLGFSKKGYVLPNIVEIVMESFFINEYMYDMQGAKKADISIAPDTSSLSARDAKKSEGFSEVAYELAQTQLLTHKKLYERWVLEDR